MGTTYSVRLATVDDGGREAELRSLVQGILDEINGRMSTYVPDSELSRLNRLQPGAVMELSPATYAVLAAALEVSRDSGNAFDPTIGALVTAWGFGPVDGHPAAPSNGEITALRGHSGIDKLRLDDATLTVSKADALLSVDLSAIAKGYAVDAVVAGLEAAGIDNYMVEVGGEVRVGGHRQPGEPWRIGIERPDAGAQHILRAVPLVDLSLATSGNYRNFYVLAGRTVGHTIDPRTGRPIDHNGASVSVIHEQCMMADALATTLMVMGPEDGLLWATERGIAALFVTYDGKTFVEQPTPEFERLVAGALESADAGIQ